MDILVTKIFNLRISMMHSRIYFNFKMWHLKFFTTQIFMSYFESAVCTVFSVQLVIMIKLWVQYIVESIITVSYKIEHRLLKYNLTFSAHSLIKQIVEKDWNYGWGLQNKGILLFILNTYVRSFIFIATLVNNCN